MPASPLRRGATSACARAAAPGLRDHSERELARARAERLRRGRDRRVLERLRRERLLDDAALRASASPRCRIGATRAWAATGSGRAAPAGRRPRDGRGGNRRGASRRRRDARSLDAVARRYWRQHAARRADARLPAPLRLPPAAGLRRRPRQRAPARPLARVERRPRRARAGSSQPTTAGTILEDRDD